MSALTASKSQYENGNCAPLQKQATKSKLAGIKKADISCSSQYFFSSKKSKLFVSFAINNMETRNNMLENLLNMKVLVAFFIELFSAETNIAEIKLIASRPMKN
ncbi:hypothetical protein FACS1894113_4990 [Alphaproteobacteria bacterium]|nr:hypothetical protein FACS1894113_4990 [Alphaproteobacteria bacterium]